MTYVLLDPPVNAFSPRSKIEAWIEHLEMLSADVEFSGEQGRDAIEAALREAHSWLDSAATTASPAAGPHGTTQP